MESQVGHGSTFLFCFELEQEKPMIQLSEISHELVTMQTVRVPEQYTTIKDSTVHPGQRLVQDEADELYMSSEKDMTRQS